ncbi:MAG: EutN/CcmL family microcompartment protein [Anaerolineae bacterium]
MEIGKIIGTIISTIKHPAYHGKKLLLVQPMHLPEQVEPEAFIAIDHAQAGIGDTVLVMREGNGARQVTGIKDAPIISVVIGVLDS